MSLTIANRQPLIRNANQLAIDPLFNQPQPISTVLSISTVTIASSNSTATLPTVYAPSSSINRQPIFVYVPISAFLRVYTLFLDRSDYKAGLQRPRTTTSSNRIIHLVLFVENPADLICAYHRLTGLHDAASTIGLRL